MSVAVLELIAGEYRTVMSSETKEMTTDVHLRTGPALPTRLALNRPPSASTVSCDRELHTEVPEKILTHS